MNFIRKRVAGKRRRFDDGEYNLDMAYVTPRMIAMSYPADNFIKKIYRNDMTDVSKYLKEKHNDKYHVYNLSGKGYDTSMFNGNVTIYEWADHHSPTLVLLAELC